MRFSRYAISAPVDQAAALYGGMSGALHTMTLDERTEIDAFLGGTSNGESIQSLLEELVRSRIIVSDDCDEITELRGRYDDSRWRSDSLGYTVVTSLGCNFDCPYCFESKHPSLLKPEVAEALVEILEDSLPSINQMNVTWMGGEPLVGKKQLFELSKLFMALCKDHDKQYAASIITNGWYLDAETAKELTAHNVRRAQVTIDGPPDIHNLKRPHRNGGPTFDRIMENVVAACEHIEVFIRVNVDTGNVDRIEEMLDLFVSYGLAGRVGVGLGKVTDAFSNDESPLATYTTSCMTAPEFSAVELAFNHMAAQRGFGVATLPTPIATPCTAVRAREIVVGSDGEMWKCWDDIGDPRQSLGTVFDYRTTNAELERWLAYHPADDPQCSSCIAMPVCMGGCAHHEFHSEDREARCGSFRHNHVERVTIAARHALGLAPGLPAPMPAFDEIPTSNTLRISVPVAITRRRNPTRQPAISVPASAD